MYSIDLLQQKINASIADLHLDREPKALFQPIRYSMSIGGKRMRPLLCLMACDLVGGDIIQAMPAALGIEIFHNFTLVHDDIMDNAPLRRGQETVYKKWNTNIAILSGDTMFALAYEHMAASPRHVLPDILDVFTNTAREVCEGQQYDMDFELQDDTSLEEYLRMIRLKTAVLLGCSLKVGALAGGGDRDTADRLYRIGENLGIAFQIRDDYLDTFGDEKLFGKKTGGDILANKKTYLYLAALIHGRSEVSEELKKIYLENTMEPEAKIRKVKALFTEARVGELCESTTAAYYQAALDEFEKLNITGERIIPLKEFARKLIGRNY
jgi:geranylgeranyl diphosphate synthase type II